MILGEIIPGRSTFLHLRILFSLFLMPVFLFALSQIPHPDIFRASLCFLIWHFLVYPASNGFNSYFDKDEGSIALLEHPPEVDKSLYYFSLLLDLMAIILSLFLGWGMVIAVVIYGTISKMYSHPSVRLKKYPIISFLVVFIFQGAFIYWSTYLVIENEVFELDWSLLIPGIICSCLIGASYPLTQVYQHVEDAKRGDRTLSMMLGIKGSFVFSALLFFLSVTLLFLYWWLMQDLSKFFIFLMFLIPLLALFTEWFLKVRRDPDAANYKNMSRMTFWSSLLMLAYFGLLNFI